MKTSLLCLALMLPLAAQETVRPPRPRTPQPPPPAGLSPSSSAAEAGQQLADNVTIKLSGRFAGVAVDCSVTGIGPSFTSQGPVNESILNCNYILSETDSGYLINYSIGLRVRVPASQNNYEYRDISATGTIRCKAGKAVAILKNGEDPLILTVSPAEPDEAGKAEK